MSLQLQIETTAVCNAKCHFCVYATPVNDRLKGLMPMARYKAIIDDAATVPEVENICLTGLGEPLLDPHLEERIHYTKAKIPSKDVSIFTNGTYLTPERFERLKTAGVDMVNVSLNAVSGAQRKEIMQLEDWDRVIEQISYAVSHAGDTKVRISVVVNKDKCSESDSLLLIKLWGHWRYGGHVELVREGNWAGENRTVREFDPDEACIRALTQFYVLWDGTVSACCFDPTARMRFGQVPEQSIREVYNSEAYAAFRELHSENRASQVEICKGCSRI